MVNNKNMTEHHAFVTYVDIGYFSLSEFIKDNLFFVKKELELIEIERFGIDNSRYLIEQSFIKPAEADKKLIVVIFSSITIEAEQALLKILEEPPLTTQFLFILPKGLSLLSTLNSRLQKIEFEAKGGRKLETLESFSKLSFKDRIGLIEKELKKEKSDWVKKIKNDLLLELENNSNKYSLKVLESLNFVIGNLNTRGAANKMLLEELALALPN